MFGGAVSDNKGSNKSLNSVYTCELQSDATIVSY